MNTMFQSLGFKYATLGAPLTDVELCANRRLYRGFLLVATLLFAASWIALICRGTLYGPAGPLTPWDTIAAFGMFGGLLAGMVTDADLGALADTRVVTGQAYLELMVVADQHGVVRHHLDAIYLQGRPVRACDEYLLQDWFDRFARRPSTAFEDAK